MKKHLCTLLLTVVSIQTICAQQQRLDSFMSKASQLIMKEYPDAALSIGITKSGKKFFYNYGTIAAGSLVQPNEHTLYEIGSLTKTFINYVLAKAVSEKRVQLKDDIRKYLKGSYPNLEYNGLPITLNHLANTTSGLPDWLPSFPAGYTDTVSRLQSAFYRHMGKEDLYKALHDIKLDTIPGINPKHSNAAAQLLAYILEDIYQQPVYNLIKKYTAEDLKNTVYIPDKKDVAAKGYDGKGKEQPYLTEIPYFAIIGGLRSTTADLLHYAARLMDSTNKTSSLILTPDIYISAATNKVIEYQYKGADPTVYSLGLGWFRYEPEAAHLQIWTNGNTSGFNSYLIMYPKSGSAIVLLSNQSDEKIYSYLPAIASEIGKILNDL